MMAKKRILSWLVAASLALSLLPAAALAAEEDENPSEPPAAAPVEDVYREVVDKIDETWTDRDQNTADSAADAIYDALYAGEKKPEKEDQHFTKNDIESAIDSKDQEDPTVITDAATAETEAGALEEDLNDTVAKATEKEVQTEIVDDGEGNETVKPVFDEEGNAVLVDGEGTKIDQSLDDYITEKADKISEAKDAAAKAVKDLPTAEDMQAAVEKGDVKSAEAIVEKVNTAAVQTEAAYNQAAAAYAQANAAVEAAKADYNKVVSDALAAADEAVLAEKLDGKSLEELTDEEKAALAVELANDKIAAANNALNTAEHKLDAANNALQSAADAQKIADRYDALVKELEGKTDVKEIVAILAGLETLDSEKTPLDGLDEKIDATTPGSALVQEAIDYTRANDAKTSAENTLNDLRKNEDAKNIPALTGKIASDLDTLWEKCNHDTHLNFDKEIESFKFYFEMLQTAHTDLRDPDADHEAAENDLNTAVKYLFEGYPILGSLGFQIGYEDSLTKKLLNKTFTGKETKPLKENIYGSLISLLEADKRIRESGYNQEVLDAVQAVNTASGNLADAKTALDTALAAFNKSLNQENGTNCADAVTTSAQLAAVLKASADNYVLASRENAEEKAREAKKAAQAVEDAKQAYADAKKAVIDAHIQKFLSSEDLTGLLNDANDVLKQAKIDLDAAKADKEKADEAKAAAENIVEDARKKAEELNKDPENPGKDPENPGKDPENPGKDPENPGKDPENPGKDPENPGKDPENPGQNPENPGQNPENPGQNPENPGKDPENPGKDPENPGKDPENPGQNPENPGQNPENPGQNPGVTDNDRDPGDDDDDSDDSVTTIENEDVPLAGFTFLDGLLENPEGALTRADFIYALYLMDGNNGKMEAAFIWALENKLVATGNWNDAVTAPAAAVILYRYSVLKGYDVPDAETEAVTWALETEILTRSTGSLTRAEGLDALLAYYLTYVDVLPNIA